MDIIWSKNRDKWAASTKTVIYPRVYTHVYPAPTSIIMKFTEITFMQQSGINKVAHVYRRDQAVLGGVAQYLEDFQMYPYTPRL